MLDHLKNFFAADEVVTTSRSLKQVIVVRTDLKMGKGKIAAQVSHASLTSADRSPYKSAWMGQGQKKTVLKVSSLSGIESLAKKAKKAQLPHALITDAGHTQIKSGTKTCLGIGPAPEAQIDELTGDLKLL